MIMKMKATATILSEAREPKSMKKNNNRSEVGRVPNPANAGGETRHKK
jgi:hypothetical protein